MPFADINGQRLYYEDTGGFGPAIVFSHGMLFDSTMFASQVAAFRDRYRCIIWDERGHGKTATDTEPGYSYKDSANDLSGLLSYLEIESAILVGAAKGAFLGMTCALARPELVRALVLIGAHVGSKDPATIASYREMVGGWITGRLPDALATEIEHTALGPGWPGASAWKEKWRAMSASNLLSAIDACVRRDDISDRICSIKVPTLIIHGDADAVISLSKAQAIRKAIPNSELVVVPGGHAVSMTNPDPVNAALRGFFVRHHLEPRLLNIRCKTALRR